MEQVSKADKAQLIILGTSIDSEAKANEVLKKLKLLKVIEEVSIDLEDCENVLRIACKEPVSTYGIIEMIQDAEVFCYELPDD